MRQTVALLGALILVIAAGGLAIGTTVTFNVTVPCWTTGTVYLVGDFNGWNPAGWAMTHVSGNLWTYTADIAVGSYGYKYTRGSWGTVEKGAGCSEVGNRSLSVGSDPVTVNDTVVTWADTCGTTWPVTVTFKVTVPAWTNSLGKTVCIAGSFTGWSHQPMTKVADNVWEYSTSLNAGDSAQYKYTLGDWGTVEKDATGNDIPNRNIGIVDLSCNHTMLQQDSVANWGGYPVGGPSSHKVDVTFKVTVPYWTPDNSTVCIAGSITSWNHTPMTKVGVNLDGSTVWEITFHQVDDGVVIEYKYTRGSWKSVEKGPHRVEIPNRKVTVTDPNWTGKMLVTDTVVNWRDIPEGGPREKLVWIDAPQPNQVFLVGQPATCKWHSDPKATVIAATAPSGGAIDTSQPGLHWFAVSYLDEHGRKLSEQVAYEVVYKLGSPFTGINAARFLKAGYGPGRPYGLHPIVATYNLGDTVHIAVTPRNFTGSLCTHALISLSIVRVRWSGATESYDVLPYVFVLHYDSAQQAFVYDLNTNQLGPGVYDLWIGAGENTRVRVDVKLAVSGTPAVSMKDPAGDDDGPGTYTYPTDPVFSQKGLFDLVDYSIYDAGTYWVFAFDFANLSNPWNGPLGFSFPIILLYMDVESGGSTVSGPGAKKAQVQFDPNHPWDAYMKIAGWPAYGRGLYDAHTKTWHIVDVATDPSHNRVLVSVPKKILPNVSGWHYLLIGSQDGYATDQIRTIGKVAGAWTGGGCPDPAWAPQIYDYLTPPGYTQKQILDSYNAQKKQFATLIPVQVQLQK